MYVFHNNELLIYSILLNYLFITNYRCFCLRVTNISHSEITHGLGEHVGYHHSSPQFFNMQMYSCLLIHNFSVHPDR